MPKSRPPYPHPPELRRRMVELVRSGRNPEELGAKFEPTAQPIRKWVRQADRDDGRRADGLTTDERQELRRLQRENRVLRKSGRSQEKPRPGSLNAMCESFFATLECELIDRRRFKNQVEARMAIFEFIEEWSNPHPRHSALDYLSPLNYERRTQPVAEAESHQPFAQRG